MNTKTIVIFVVGVGVLVGLFVLLKPESLNQYNTETLTEVSDEKVFSIRVANRKVMGDSILKVSQGDFVTIRVTSDVSDELHLHGYDKSLDLEKGVEGSISFIADTTGRFEFELEKSGLELGVLEVTPKQ